MIKELPLGGTVGAAEGLVLTGGSPGAREEEWETKRALTGATSRPALKQAALPALTNDIVDGDNGQYRCQWRTREQRKRYAARCRSSRPVPKAV